MSFTPRRRRLLLVWLGAFVVLALVVGGSVALSSRSSGGSSGAIAHPSAPRPAISATTTTSTSAAGSAAAPASTPPRPPDDQPGPVILVPGYGGDEQMLAKLAARLQRAGRTTVTLALPNDATGDLRGQEQVLAAQAAAELKRGAASVDLVGYSAGGIVVALFVAAEPSHVRRVVTLGSPLHGTQLAGLAAGLVPSACPTACEQMVPGSPLLASLGAAAPTSTGVPWLALWTSQDQVVTPPDSARFDGATNVELQTVCADDGATHVSLPEDPLADGLTVRALDSRGLPLASASASDCVALRALGS